MVSRAHSGFYSTDSSSVLEPEKYNVNLRASVLPLLSSLFADVDVK